MRPPHNNNNRRQRGGNNRSHNNGGGNNNNRRGNGQPVNLRNQIFDSHGPGGERVRGNAFQVHEKYLSLARDAEERIDQENYYQHAEHYYRIVEAIQEMEAEQRARFTVVEQADPFGAPDGDDQPLPAGMGEQPSFGDAPEGAQEQRQPRRERFERRERQPRAEMTGSEETSSPSFSISDTPADADAAPAEKAEQAPAAAPRRTRRPVTAAE